MSTPAAVEFTNVSRRFGPVVAVDSPSASSPVPW